MASASLSLPARICVGEVISSRYDDRVSQKQMKKGSRPFSWDERREGIDTVKSTEGKVLKLLSDGGQSPPHEGWVLLLTGGNEQGYTWTLYGLPPAV